MLEPQHPTGQESMDRGRTRWFAVLLIPLALLAVLFAGFACAKYFLSRGAPATDRTDDFAHAATGDASRLDGGLDVLRAPETQKRWHADDARFAPDSDGWESESFAAQAKTQLEQLAGLLSRPEKILPEELATYVSDDFSGQSLRPADLREVASDESITVWRGAARHAPAAHHRGVNGLTRALRVLAKPLARANDVQVHIKIHAVTITPTSAETTVDFEAHGRLAEGTIQQNATWICRWARRAGNMPQLTSIRVDAYEEVVGRAPAGTWFTDCTEAVLAHEPSFHQQIVFGLNHWLRRIERVHGMQVYARTGLALGDVNGDGLDDIYLCQPGGLPNRLYVQNLDGTVTDRSRWAGVDWLEESHGSLLVDLDNDGDQDLALACTAGIILMENDSSGKFRVRQRLKIERSVESLSAVDYDGDGDLDLYNCVYRPDPGAKHEGSASEFLYHDANNGGVNRMFRNDISITSGDSWRFVDVTSECGLDKDNRRWSLAASWEDYDNDGDQDLYVANDYGQNCLYRNDAGQFVNVADAAGVVDFGSGMSVSWADFNHDGWMDLYVGNMFSSAGNRIAAQKDFLSHSGEATRRVYRRFAKGNSLFANIDGSRFRETGADAAVEMGRWAWTSLFVDVNNDGWDDLLVANGFITAEDERDL